MRTIRITDDDRRAGGLATAGLDAAVAALREDGFVALADAVDPAHVAALRAAALADVAAIASRSDAPFNWNAGNLQQSAPLVPELLFRDVLANDAAVAVACAVLGDGVVNGFYSGNTAMPRSTDRQPVHGDGGHLWPVADTPPRALVVNVPLVDIGPDNGGTELWPGSHRVPARAWNDSLEIPAEALAERRRTAPPIGLRIAAGSLLLRDDRLWHAGVPNASDAPRPMLALIYTVAWWPLGEPLRLPRGAEAAVAHPRLRTHAVFTDEPIDHRRLAHAYGYGGVAS